MGAETCFAGGLWFLLCGSLRRLWERPSRVFCDVWFLVTFCLVSFSGCYFQFVFLQINVILETDTIIFGTQNLPFGRPGASTLAPWGIMERSRGTWGLKKGNLGAQAWLFIDFGLISGPHFESFSDSLDENMCFFQCLFPGHFFT